MIHEYECRDCDETFIGDGYPVEMHGQKVNGEFCGGWGDLRGTYSPAR